MSQVLDASEPSARSVPCHLLFVQLAARVRCRRCIVTTRRLMRQVPRVASGPGYPVSNGCER